MRKPTDVHQWLHVDSSSESAEPMKAQIIESVMYEVTFAPPFDTLPTEYTEALIVRAWPSNKCESFFCCRFTPPERTAKQPNKPQTVKIWHTLVP